MSLLQLFLARNTRSRRNAVYPQLLQFGFAGALVALNAPRHLVEPNIRGTQPSLTRERR